MKVIVYIIFAAIGLFISFFVLMAASFAQSSGIYLLWLVFYLIAIIFLVFQAEKGNGPAFSFVLVLPPILAVLVALLFAFAANNLKHVQKNLNYSEFQKVCRNSGTKFYKLPTTPVHSVANDRSCYPYYNYYETSDNGKIVYKSGKMHDEYYNKTFPDQIEFIECLNNEGKAKHIRDLSEQRKFSYSQDINKWSADVMVEHKIKPLRWAFIFPLDIYRHHIIVKDRRNGQALAELKYFINKMNQHACGLTNAKEIDEKYFVLKAIGLEK